MSDYPLHFKTLLKKVLTIDEYLRETFNVDIKNVTSGADQERLQSRIVDRVVIGIPHTFVEYESSAYSHAASSSSSSSIFRQETSMNRVCILFWWI